METMINEISNVGFTLLCVVVSVVIVRWLDRNIFSNGDK